MAYKLCLRLSPFTSTRTGIRRPIARAFVLTLHNHHTVRGIANRSEDNPKQFDQSAGENQFSKGTAAPHQDLPVQAPAQRIGGLAYLRRLLP
jgi:hypothetical protein